MKCILTLQKLKSSLIEAVEDAKYYEREARKRSAMVEDLRHTIEVLEAAAAARK